MRGCPNSVSLHLSLQTNQVLVKKAGGKPGACEKKGEKPGGAMKNQLILETE